MKIHIRRRTRPQCPECDATISFGQEMKIWNPWRVRCPACSVMLEMSLFGKIAGVLAVPFGLAVVGVAVYMKETKRWGPADSLVYLAVVTSTLLVVGGMFMPTTRFLSRTDKANDSPQNSPPPMELMSWLKQAGRAGLMMAPRWRGLHTGAWLIAILVLFDFLITLTMQWLAIAGPAIFNWRAIFGGWISTAILVWLCYLMRQKPADEPEGDIAPSAAHLITMALAQSMILGIVFSVSFAALERAGMYTEKKLGSIGIWVVWLTPVIWALIAQMVLLIRCGDRNARTRIMAVLGTVVLAFLLYEAKPDEFWYADESGNAADKAPRLRLTQELMEAQQRLLAGQLDNIKPQRPGVIDLYSITYAPYQEAVFRRESAVVDQVMTRRFDAKGHTLQLLNDAQTTERLPWATPLNLQRAIQRFAKVMDRDEDVLFIHLTSHGASDGKLASSFWPLEVARLVPAELKKWLDEAGIKNRVISISACYSGSWADALANENTLVMTAADADHTSYGCGSKSDLTFFGRAMYDEQLRNVTFSFEQAHRAARAIIKKREEEAGKDDGYSNPQIKVGAGIRSRLSSLEAQLQLPLKKPALSH